MPRLTAAIVLGRSAGWLSRLTGRGGTAIPGLVAERVDPRTIERIIEGLPGGVILVTGTNGKTTTTKLLVAALEASGQRVITNRSGSNLERGVAAALIGQSSWRGRPDGDIAVIEADEAAVRRLAPRVKPRLLVVTNLARDQLDRFGELDATAAHLSAALEHAQGSVLNGDDPRVAALGGSDSAYVGASDPIRALMPSDDQIHSPAAGDGPRPELTVEVLEAQADGDGQMVGLGVDGETWTARLQVPGVYNACNAGAALAAAIVLGVDPAVAMTGFEATAPPFGRGQVVEYQGRRVSVLLVKNPAGLNQAIRLLSEAPPAPVVVAINDLDADGRDVSWLWDASVEDLARSGHRFGASGLRAADMALRFKYAGIEAWVEPRLAEALSRAVDDASPGETVYVVPTYTAMLALLDQLLPGVPRSEVWT